MNENEGHYAILNHLCYLDPQKFRQWTNDEHYFFISSVVIETFIWGNLDGCIQHIRCLSTVGVTWGRKQYYKKWEKK